MTIDTTVPEIDALLQLAELDAQAPSLPPEKHRSHREAARRRVPRELLDRYQKLLDVGRRPAIVAIERGGCSGCHVRLPTMLEYKARRSPAIHSCPHCHRMLYAPEFHLKTAHSPISAPVEKAKAANAKALKARNTLGRAIPESAVGSQPGAVQK